MGCGGLVGLDWQGMRTQGSCRRRGHFHSCGAVKDRWRLEYLMLHSMGEPPFEHEKLALLPSPSQSPPRSLARQEHPAPPGRPPRLGTQAPRLGPLKKSAFPQQKLCATPTRAAPLQRCARRILENLPRRRPAGWDLWKKTRRAEKRNHGWHGWERAFLETIRAIRVIRGPSFLKSMWRGFSQRSQAIARSSARSSPRRVPSAFPCRLSENAGPAIAGSR